MKNISQRSLLTSAKPLGKSRILSSGDCRALMGVSRERKVWFRLFNQIPQTTQGFSSGNPGIDSSVPGVTPRVWWETESSSTMGFIKRSHQRSKGAEDMQSLPSATTSAKLSAGKAPAPAMHSPPVPPNSHGEAPQETLPWLSWLGLSVWAVDDFRIWFWPAAQIMSSSLWLYAFFCLSHPSQHQRALLWTLKIFLPRRNCTG